VLRRIACFAGLLLTVFVVLALAGERARADVATPADVEQARADYTRGTELAKKEDWAEALAAFKRSYEKRPHPTTLYNIATCRRVLGEYTAARAQFEEVLRPGSVEQLPETLVANAKGYKDELDRIVTHVTITIEPPEAEIAIDGKPLKTTDAKTSDGAPIALAGVLPSGRGTAAPTRKFEAIVDPGTRVIVISRKGYRDVVRTERFIPGASMALALDLEKLPATLRITANVESPIVTVNGVDVGMAPVDVPRAAGKYRVVVTKDGFVPHAMVVDVLAGEDPKLDASLVPETVPITKRWWFWAGAAAIVAGGVAITYAATRPDPVPPDYARGNTGWLVELGR
jgi:hypothetical protein